MLKISNGVKKLTALSIGLILIAAACNQTTTPAVTPPVVTPPVATPPVTNPPTPTPPVSSTTVIVTYGSSGFSPASVTVKKGTEVIFVNNSSGNFWPASAPHPSHTDYPALDPRNAIAAGNSWSFVFDKVGTWKYHDHLNPVRGGSVTVTN